MKDAKKGKVDCARACFLSQEDSIEGKERHVLKGEALMTLQDRVNPWTTGRQASNWPNPFWRDTTGAFTSLFDIAEGKHLSAKTHWSKTDLLIQHFTSTLETPNQRPTTVSHKNGKEDEASGSDACEAGRFRYLGYPVSNGSPKSRRDEKSKGCRELLCVDKVRQN
jgi:hypothetical protein